MNTLKHRIRALRIRNQEGIWLAWFEDWVCLLEAGLPVLESLHLSRDMMQLQSGTRALQLQLERVGSRIQAGQSLREAFLMDPQGLPHMLEAALRSSAHAGDLAVPFRQYLLHWKSQRSLKQQLHQSLIYPLTVLVMAVGAWVLMNKQLPTPTVAVEPADTQGLWGLGLMGAGLLSLLLLLSIRARGRRQDTHGPSIRTKGWLASEAWLCGHFFFELATGLHTGIDLMTCLRQTCAGIQRNGLTRQKTHRQLLEFGLRIQKHLQQGLPLNLALQNAGAPAFLVRQAQVAELTGDLGRCFGMAARVFALEAQRRQQRMLRWLGPLTLACAAAVMVASFQTTLAPLYAGLGG